MKYLFASALIALNCTQTYAADATDLYRFDFDCKYQQNQFPNDHVCTANASVFADVNAWDRKNAQLYNDNLLTVTCDGEVVYSDGGILYSGNQFVQVAAPSGNPMITVKRKDLSLENIWNTYEAHLTIGRHTLEGVCKVRATRMDRHVLRPAIE